jgi:hypothetical protein
MVLDPTPFAAQSCAMQSFAELLSLWPSLARIAAELEVPYDTVIAWKRRNSVPYEYWTALTASALQNNLKGVTMEIMAEAAEVLRRERRQQRRVKRQGKPNRHRRNTGDAIRIDDSVAH